MNISKISALEILDSRGNPTVQATVILEAGRSVSASVPSGASVGAGESHEKRDGDARRYHGKGVQSAVSNIENVISPALSGMEVFFQRALDEKLLSLDGTPQKEHLGANALLAVSLTVARAGAMAKEVELFQYLASTYDFPLGKYTMPIPLFNIVNGGKHADTNLDIQELHIIPSGLRERGFSEMLRAGAEIFHELGIVLKERGFDTDVGDEGGYAPDISSTIQMLDMIMAAITRAGYKPGEEIFLGADIGSSVLWREEEKRYTFKLDRGVMYSSDLIGLYEEWLRKYPFLLIEDGVAENDWKGWKELTARLGDELILVGDDLFCTHIKKIEQGIHEKVANAVLIKPNQVGTLSETIDAIQLSLWSQYKVVLSHRSGETCDSFIADLAVACGAQFIKAGAPNRGERTAKYNRLLEIESLLKKI